MATIQSIKARLIFDWRGNHTFWVKLRCSDGTSVGAAHSSLFEGIFYGDDTGLDYLTEIGSKEVDYVNKIIAPALIGKDPTQQTAIDNLIVQQHERIVKELGNLSWLEQKLGQKTIAMVSLAVCRAGASVLKLPHYMYIREKLALSPPSFNIINGGSHAGNKLPMQDFMVHHCVGASPFMKSTMTGPEEYPLLKDAVNVGDEVGFSPNIQVVVGMGVAASQIYKSDKTYDLNFIAAEAGYTGKVVVGMGVAASEIYKPDKTHDLNFIAANAGYPRKVVVVMGVAAPEFYKSDKTYDPFVIAAKTDNTGKHLCWQHSNHEETCSALDLMMNRLRDGNDLIQMHENFGTHDGQFQEGEGGPEDNGFVHDMSLDGVADDPMQIDAVEDYPNYATHSVQVYFNQNSMGLIDTTGIDSPDQLKGAAILIAHLPTGQYIFKYVRYGQEIRMDNDDFHHFLEDLTDIHIWDGELVTVS